MKWYEVVFVIIVVIIGAYLRGKIYEHKNGYYRYKKKK